MKTPTVADDSFQYIILRRNFLQYGSRLRPSPRSLSMLQPCTPRFLTATLLPTLQTCNSRIFVQAGVYDKFIELLVKKFKQQKIGDASDESTFHGPMGRYTVV
jgi:hypothetical protein